MTHIPMTVESSNLRLELLPSCGGRIGRLQALSGRKMIDLLCPFGGQKFDPYAWPKSGAFPLIPYSNRIRNASFSFQNSTYQLPPHPVASPHTLHGICQTLPWRVTGFSQGMIKMAVEYSGPHWPWPIRAEQRYTLHDDRLDIRFALKNIGVTAMPGGIGFHPYFLAEDMFEAHFRPRRQWVVGQDRLPVSIRPHASQSVTITPSDWRDHDFFEHYSDIADDIVLRYAEATLSIRTSENLRHLVAYAPRGRNYLCLEPASHVSNGMNLSCFCNGEIGMHVIPAGGILVGDISMSWNSKPEKIGALENLYNETFK